METYLFTCTHGGQEIVAGTHAEVCDRIARHEAFWHSHGGRCWLRPVVAPIRPAYRNGGAYGVTEKGAPTL
jgi:hypothetical protein